MRHVPWRSIHKTEQLQQASPKIEMTPDAESVLQSWSAPLGLYAVLLLTAFVYVRGWRHLRKGFPSAIPAWRLAAYVAGIGCVCLALGSPLAAFDESSLTVHMIQHLLLMSFAPPLVLLGAPALPLLHGLPQFLARGVVGPVLRWRPLQWLGGFLTNPAVGWSAAALTLLVWHVPAIFDLTLHSDSLHKFEHGTFFGVGLIFWWPVIQPWPSVPRWPRWSIPLYLFAATLPCDVLSGFLVFCDRVVYSSYRSAPKVLGLAPLPDQQCAAALMWVCVTIILLVPAVLITMQILSPQKQFPTPEKSVDSSSITGQSLDTPQLKVI
jgi:putative membrane protein